MLVGWGELRTYDAVLLQFSAAQSDVVLSSVVRRALDSIGTMAEPSRLAIGGCFTAEARHLLTEAGFVAYSLHEFHWTDKSYKKISRAVPDEA